MKRTAGAVHSPAALTTTSVLVHWQWLKAILARLHPFRDGAFFVPRVLVPPNHQEVHVMATEHSNELNKAFAHRLEGNDLESFPMDGVGNALDRAISVVGLLIIHHPDNALWAAQKEIQDAKNLIDLWHEKERATGGGS